MLLTILKLFSCLLIKGVSSKYDSSTFSNFLQSEHRVIKDEINIGLEESTFKNISLRRGNEEAVSNIV